jgi:hypothetical protein
VRPKGGAYIISLGHECGVGFLDTGARHDRIFGIHRTQMETTFDDAPSMVYVALTRPLGHPENGSLREPRIPPGMSPLTRASSEHLLGLFKYNFDLTSHPPIP